MKPTIKHQFDVPLFAPMRLSVFLQKSDEEKIARANLIYIPK